MLEDVLPEKAQRVGVICGFIFLEKLSLPADFSTPFGRLSSADMKTWRGITQQVAIHNNGAT
jgi:hypothetical protein